MRNDHIWNAFSIRLREIYDRFVKGEDLRSDEMLIQIEQLHPFAVFIASTILRKCPYAESDAETVARRWWEIMETVGFKRFDPAKGLLVAYASQTLRNICRGDDRKGRRRRTIEIPFGSAVRSWGPSELASKREWDLAFRKAVRRLPKEPRRALILKHFLQKSSKVGAERCGVCVDTFNTRTRRARTLLREQLNPSDWIIDLPIKRTWREARNYVWRPIQDESTSQEQKP